eukprot:COSAG02_NODE_4722_length_5052_cov_9.256612_5_plen_82_part_00
MYEQCHCFAARHLMLLCRVWCFCARVVLYLWDEEANLLVMATSLCAILVDVWKVQRAMSVQFYLAFGFLPWLSLVRAFRLH